MKVQATRAPKQYIPEHEITLAFVCWKFRYIAVQSENTTSRSFTLIDRFNKITKSTPSTGCKMRGDTGGASCCLPLAQLPGGPTRLLPGCWPAAQGMPRLLSRYVRRSVGGYYGPVAANAPSRGPDNFDDDTPQEPPSPRRSGGFPCPSMEKCGGGAVVSRYRRWIDDGTSSSSRALAVEVTGGVRGNLLCRRVPCILIRGGGGRSDRELLRRWGGATSR